MADNNKPKALIYSFKNGSENIVDIEPLTFTDDNIVNINDYKMDILLEALLNSDLGKQLIEQYEQQNNNTNTDDNGINES